MVARDGDVVEEHRAVGAAADAHPLALDREALAHAPPAGADHQRRPVRGDLAELDRHQLSALVDAVGGGDRIAARSLAVGGVLIPAQRGAAALAEVGALAVGESRTRGSA